MAAIESKRSLHRAQPRAHGTIKPKPKNKKKKRITDGELTEFPPVKGKKLEGVQFSNSIDFHSIHLRFEDQTELSFDLHPGFTLFADYADWKTGNRRPIRKWGPIRSRLFRE